MQNTASQLSRGEIAQSMQANRALEALAIWALRQIEQWPCRWASIVQFDHEAGVALVLATNITSPSAPAPQEQPPVATGARLPLEMFASIPQLRLRKIYLVEDILPLSAPSKATAALAAGGVRSCLHVPLLGQAEDGLFSGSPLLGCLELTAETPGAFTAEHIKLACQVADILGAAMQQTMVCASAPAPQDLQVQRLVGDLEHWLADGTGFEWEFISSVAGKGEQQEKISASPRSGAVAGQPALSVGGAPEQQHRLGGAGLRAVRHCANLQEILSTSADLVRQLLQAERAIVYRYGGDMQGSVVAESVGPGWPSMLGLVLRLRAPAAPLGVPWGVQNPYLRQYQLGGIQAVGDIHSAGLDSCHIQLLELFDIKSMLVAPILIKSEQCLLPFAQSEVPLPPDVQEPDTQLWGLLMVHQCASTRQWQQFDIDLLGSLVTQVKVAVEQSRLLEIELAGNTLLARHVEERTAELQQAQEALAAIERITDKLRDSLDERVILQAAVRELALALRVDRCSASTYSADGTTRTSCCEYPPSELASQAVPPVMASSPEVCHQLLLCQDVQFCPIGGSKSLGAVAMLVCPIFHSQEAIGDLCLVKPPEGAFREQEIRLVRQVASHCAIAIRQARLDRVAHTHKAELDKLARLQEDFLSTVPHELRTPLANMKMAIQMLAIALNQDREFFADLAKPEAQRSKVARYFQIVRNECEREIRLIEDLLELQQLDAGSHPWAPAIIDPHRVIPEIVRSFQGQAQRQQQALALDMPADLLPVVGDPLLVGRILRELLTNACKYTPAGEQITVSVSITGGCLHLSVTNSGADIPEQELSQIFRKFYRIPKADQWQQGGTGLGLAVVQKLTERLGGSIQVSSEAGLTCFRVELPVSGLNKGGA
ncbi:GAF domain-containing protein [Kamptonema formosum]|uniref:GAF domain-containing protein n=1 Tax=Kamptonema formosum TaxID=331992 RepID=UPI00034C5297|nr:GAF domain-containing protein [Oscillatoria sp. PCC 10802]